MIVQIGTDIVEIEKLKYSVTKEPFASDPFIRHTFTEKKSGLHFYGLIRCLFATRFAGKEAVFKALNITGEDVRLSEIKGNTFAGKWPSLRQSLWQCKETAKALGINNMHLSLSYEDHYAIAFAVAED